MTDKLIFEHLQKVLADNGLDYNDPEVFKFFNSLLPKRVNVVTDENGNVKKYNNSPFIRPVVKKVLPSDFANSGYYDDAQDDTILDWFMYRNSSGNPLVWKNIGKDSSSIKASFVKRRNELDPAKVDAVGNLFNGEDGNHRLLTLKINHFIERQKAKTEHEIAEIDKKYEMEIEIDLPFSSRLCRALSDIYNEMFTSSSEDALIPKFVAEYRSLSYENYNESMRFVEYDEQTKIFNYRLNDVEFSGTEEELIEFLQTAEIHNMPLMQWQADGISYISCYNHVWKSTDSNYMEKLYPKIEQAYLDGKIEKHTFLEIKDVDTQTYEVRFPEIFEYDETSVELILQQLDYLTSTSNAVFNKLTSYTEQDLKEVIKTNDYWKGFSLGELRYEGLTREEVKEIESVLSNFEDILEEIKSSETTKEE